MLRAYGEGDLFGDCWGDGPVSVLWLHGWARSHQDFFQCGSLLAAAGHASVALDLPGFGASALPTVAWGAQQYAEFLHNARSTFCDRPLVIVGHSFGGRVAVTWAASYPEDVAALVLTGVPLLHSTASRRPPRAYRALRALHARGLVSPVRMERARQRYGSSDYRNASGLLRDILVTSVNESYEPQLRALQCPTKLVWGSADRDVPLAVAERAAAMITDGTLQVLEGVGHLVPTQAPDALADVTAALVSSC